MLEDGGWLLQPHEVQPYREARARGLRHDAATVAAQDPLYYGFVPVVAPEHYMAAANRPEMTAGQIINRLVTAQGYSREDLYRPEAMPGREPDPTNASAVAPDELEPWLVGLSEEELLGAGIVKPKHTLRERKGITTDGDPNRPSQQPGARWARKKRQRARERLVRQSGG
jgi:hypothetical protein